jgi:hypothetical protein
MLWNICMFILYLEKALSDMSQWAMHVVYLATICTFLIHANNENNDTL